MTTKTQRNRIFLPLAIAVIVAAGFCGSYLLSSGVFGLQAKKVVEKVATVIEPAKSQKEFNVNQPYDAPEIQNIDAWINSPPLRIEDLRNKVVLIDFWTYLCINCRNTQSHLNGWWDAYKDKGLVIIGVHAPETSYERVQANVEQAVKDAGIGYPVALDNNFTTWRNYNNQYWPARYLIDKSGRVRYTHFGEGDYDGTNSAIQDLLAEPSTSKKRL